MRYVFDTKLKRAMWIENGVAIDEISGEVFAINQIKDDLVKIPIMYSSYEIIVNGMACFYESQMKNDEWIYEINEELRKYGV